MVGRFQPDDFVRVEGNAQYIVVVGPDVAVGQRVKPNPRWLVKIGERQVQLLRRGSHVRQRYDASLTSSGASRHAEHRRVDEQDALLGGRMEGRSPGPRLNQVNESLENAGGVRLRHAELVELLLHADRVAVDAAGISVKRSRGSNSASATSISSDLSA